MVTTDQTMANIMEGRTKKARAFVSKCNENIAGAVDIEIKHRFLPAGCF
ncbi:MAG: hypothetical protein GY847_09430 [Proteobacteria bacterium]|nr:hypothetical protein [Pseudomonadota bacterium]